MSLGVKDARGNELPTTRRELQAKARQKGKIEQDSKKSFVLKRRERNVLPKRYNRRATPPRDIERCAQRAVSIVHFVMSSSNISEATKVRGK